MDTLHLVALLTVADLARILRIPPCAIYTRLHRGADLPPPVRIGKSLRWNPESVRHWLAAKEAFPAVEKP